MEWERRGTPLLSPRLVKRQQGDVSCVVHLGVVILFFFQERAYGVVGSIAIIVIIGMWLSVRQYYNDGLGLAKVNVVKNLWCHLRACYSLVFDAYCPLASARLSVVMPSYLPCLCSTSLRLKLMRIARSSRYTQHFALIAKMLLGVIN